MPVLSMTTHALQQQSDLAVWAAGQVQIGVFRTSPALHNGQAVAGRQQTLLQVMPVRFNCRTRPEQHPSLTAAWLWQTCF